MTDEPHDSIEAGRRTSSMWLGLANQIADAVTEHVINGDPVKAIKWATCAEACFWKATGEADCHDVKDVLADNRTATAERTE